MSEPASARRRRAARAAVAVARRYGVDSTEFRILKDSNNTIVHLAPAPLVAKVSTSVFEDRGPAALERELRVALHLAAKGAPIVPPATEMPPGPHEHGGLVLTFWRYSPGGPEPKEAGPKLGRALQEFHRAFADFAEPLPPFTATLEEVGNLLADPANTPALAERDRRFLHETYLKLAEVLASCDLPSQPLHGEPHEGNVIWSPDGPRFVDFEAACAGPIEWDLASVSDDAAAVFAAANPNVLALLRSAKSLCVATWCWQQPHRAPEVREAAHVHLEILRGRVADGRLGQ